ncbi:MAG: CDF family Co(II)/Ni(II) efflux transporter DmeF [Candidatus Obscuribacter phosphatis]|uniref:CDF family Co(II)/Ni(II) efflux transporter DmeF n=1 Tax=Candidatus Obscuribacter phosphatis TaxID=1906157 RepID=A0A8J7TMI5_9BACT|nr:CDF family Co(II)/Ni(II) efflux transporter DmeF [Candidatus Obscuribacter phosphatis]
MEGPNSVKSCHSHSFDSGNESGEKATGLAVLITAAMMVVEIVCGWLFNSMALLADGWHMSSHALALGLSLLAYQAARKLSRDERFTFGTWKIEVLGGYSSALMLVGVALLMLYQSVEHLFRPSPIQFDQAIIVAAIGLAVNLVCAFLLQGAHSHESHSHSHESHSHSHESHSHSHETHSHSHGHDHNRDINLHSAYLHVLADAATSLLAIVALLGGKFFALNCLDPIMGIVGAFLVLGWARGLIKESALVLLDAQMNAPVVSEVREVIACLPSAAELTDLHVWRVGRGKFACIVSISVQEDLSPELVKEKLAIHEELVHITVEVNRSLSQPTLV